jgi:exodeoxyribonuclease V gamma subunit
MLQVIQSARLEGLIDRLAESIRAQRPHPAAVETVVVESVGMARTLPRELARRLGAASGLEFPFAGRFLYEGLLRPAFPELPAESGWEPAPLAWRIAAALPGLLGDEDFAPLRRALGEPPEAVELHELAQRLAALYDQYLLYRPAWLLAWEGDGEAARRSAGGPPPGEDSLWDKDGLCVVFLSGCCWKRGGAGGMSGLVHCA